MGISLSIFSDTNGKGISALRKRLEKSKRVVQVGFPSSKTHSPDGTSMAFIASVHEYGAPSAGIPERPFLKAGIEGGKEGQARLNKVNLVRILNGETDFDTALMQLGEMAKGNVQDYINQGDFAPILPATIAARKRRSVGSSKPLVDTGQMRQSVSYELGDKK